MPIKHPGDNSWSFLLLTKLENIDISPAWDSHPSTLAFQSHYPLSQVKQNEWSEVIEIFL